MESIELRVARETKRVTREVVIKNAVAGVLTPAGNRSFSDFSLVWGLRRAQEHAAIDTFQTEALVKLRGWVKAPVALLHAL